MSVFGSVVLAALASLGIALAVLEVLRNVRAKRASFINT